MAAKLAFETMSELGITERYELRGAITIYGCVKDEWYQKPTNLQPEDGAPTPTFNDAHRAAMSELRAEAKGHADTDIICGISIRTESRREARAQTTGTELRNVMEYTLTADLFALKNKLYK